MWVNDLLESVRSLQEQYSDICEILNENLSSEEFRMIQIVKRVDFSVYSSLDVNSKKRGLLQKLVTASDMTIAYLRSLDMDLNKELIETKKQREELESKTKQIETLKKTYESLINTFSDIKKGVPELARSQITEEIKKSHRSIEQHTNPNTKSQKKVLIEEKREENS